MGTRQYAKLRNWTIAIAAVVAFVAAGCSSSSTNKSSSNSNTTATTNGSTHTSANKAPIKVMIIGVWSVGNIPGLPEVRDAALAQIDAVNAAGGINGRQIEPIICNDMANPDIGAQCTAKAISEGIVASVGTGLATTTTEFPLLQRAGVADILDNAPDQTAATSPVAFVIAPNIAGSFLGMPEVCAEHGAKSVSLIYPTDAGAASASIPVWFKQGAAAAHVKVANLVGISSLSTTDFAPAVASAMQNGADCIANYDGGPAQVSIIKAIRTASPTIRIAAATFALPAAALVALGSAGNGVYLIGGGAQPTANIPAANMYRADMAKYFPHDSQTDQALGAWVSAWIFTQTASTLSDVTASTVLRAVSQQTAVNTGGFSPTLNFTQECAICGADVRYFNQYITFLTIANGALVQSPGFVNAWTNVRTNS
jgi:branched-chain amino acid transport system substrate-binding protein